MSEFINNNEGGKYGSHFVQELKVPEGMLTPEFSKIYNSFAKRILWMDGGVVPGAFQMNTAWYHSVPEKDPIFPEHEHPYDEVIGFYGSNPDDPYDLGGIIEFGIDGEMHRLTRSTIIFAPGGVPHSPVRVLKVDRPIFHFSVVMNTEYDGGGTYK